MSNELPDESHPHNAKTERFYQPSAGVSLERLLYDRRLLTYGFIFSFVFNLTIAVIITFKHLRKEEPLDMGVEIQFFVRKRYIRGRKIDTAFRMKILSF